MEFYYNQKFHHKSLNLFCKFSSYPNNAKTSSLDRYDMETSFRDNLLNQIPKKDDEHDDEGLHK